MKPLHSDPFNLPIRKALPTLSQKTINRLDDSGVVFMFQLLSMKMTDLTRIPAVGKIVVKDISNALKALGYQIGELQDHTFPTNFLSTLDTNLSDLMKEFRDSHSAKALKASHVRFSDMPEQDRAKWFDNTLPTIDISYAGQIIEGIRKKDAHNLTAQFIEAFSEPEPKHSIVEQDTHIRVRAGAIASRIAGSLKLSRPSLQMKRDFIDKVEQALRAQHFDVLRTQHFDVALETVTIALEGPRRLGKT